MPDTGADRRTTEKRPRRRFPGGLPLAVRLLAMLVLLLGLGTIAGAVALDYTYRERILPNVTIRGMAVGQLSPAEAETALNEQYAAFLEAPVALTLHGRTWEPTLDELGVALGIDDAIDRAYALGHGVNLPDRLINFVHLWRNGFEVPLHLTIDQQQTQDYLLGLARTIDRPPRDANLYVTAGQVRVITAQTGQQLLVDSTVQDLLVELQTLQPQTVALRTRLLHPAVADTGIATAHERLESLLQDSVTLTAGEQQWTWTPEELGMLVRIAHEPPAEGTGEHLVATLDQERLEIRLTQLAAQFDTAPIEPRVQFATSGLRIIREGLNGARLEVAPAVEQLTGALWHDQRTLALPVEVLQPRARPETLAGLGIVELVGQGKSSFLDSEDYRVTNIQAGAWRMNGVLIAPGEEFSFNETVGAINSSNGFTRGYAIVDGRTQLEWGGGVCQVSTTVFRAAFWGGLPITERNQHTYRISWYEKFEPVGMDAAIFTGPGGYDMRFVNNTEHWLLMEAYADTVNEVMTVNLYGTDPNRTVVQIPPRTSYGRHGLEVWVGREVTDANGQMLSKNVFYSLFRPWSEAR
ncbi:MAG: VanW family protein [Chloroflexaceae bacterium]